MIAARFLMLLSAVAGGPVQADVPRLNAIDPPAIQRGTANEIQCVGKGNQQTTHLLVPFHADVQAGRGDEDSIRFTITPAEDTPVGVYPVRVYGPHGVSNLRLITVTNVPVFRTREPNGRHVGGVLDLDSAVPIEPPCMIAGGRLSSDLDLFRFKVIGNDRLVFSTRSYSTGLTPDPVFWVRGADRKTLAWAHDTPGLRRDERLDYRFSTPGEYWLEVRSTGGAGWTNQYLLKVGDFDYAQTVFPLGGRRGELTKFTITDQNGKTETVRHRVPDDPWLDRWQLPLSRHPGSLAWRLESGSHPEVLEDDLTITAASDPLVDWPVTVNGRISEPQQIDRYRIRVSPGQQIRVSAEAWDLGSALDGYLMVYDPAGQRLLAQADDQVYRGDPDPALGFTVPDDVSEVTIAIADTARHGGLNHGYRLTIEHGGPDFYLWLGKKQNPFREDGWAKWDAADTLNLPQGGEATMTVSVRRESKVDDSYYKGPVEGFRGPIQLRAVGLPDGVTADAVTVPVGETKASITFHATSHAPGTPFEFAIVGEGQRENGDVIQRVAERKLFLCEPQMVHLPWNWRVRKVTCVTVLPEDGYDE
jgi:hypothetical protein